MPFGVCSQRNVTQHSSERQVASRRRMQYRATVLYRLTVLNGGSSNPVKQKNEAISFVGFLTVPVEL